MLAIILKYKTNVHNKMHSYMTELIAYSIFGYTLLKFIYVPSVTQLQHAIFMMNYIFFGGRQAMYVYALNQLVLNYSQWANVIGIIIPQKYIPQIKLNAHISKMCMRISQFSDNIYNAIVRTLMSKLYMIDEKIDDYMITEDETLKQINKELDHLLVMGVNLISKSSSDLIEEQQHIQECMAQLNDIMKKIE